MHLSFLKRLAAFSDMVLVSLDEVEYPCHKAYLSNKSCFFLEMLSSTSDTRVNIAMSSSELDDFLNCVYSSHMNTQINLNNVKMLTEAGRKYDMHELLTACDNFSTREVKLDEKSIFDWMPFAFEYELPDFSAKCKAYVAVEGDTAALIGNLLQRPEDSLKDKVAVCILESAQAQLLEANRARRLLMSMNKNLRDVISPYGLSGAEDDEVVSWAEKK